MMMKMMRKVAIFCLIGIVVLVQIGIGAAIDPQTQSLVDRYLPEESRQEFLRVYEDEFPAGIDIDSVLNLVSGGRPTNASCHTCQSLMMLAPSLPYEPNTVEFIKYLVCNDLHSDHVSGRMCRGLVDRLGMPILYILHNTKVPIQTEGCAVLFGHECAAFLGHQELGPYTKWELPLPAKPETNNPIIRSSIKNEEKKKTISVLHLTDVHLDLYYEPNTEARCNEALCCRPTSMERSDNITVRAGYWGEVNGDCDMPVWFVNASLQTMSKPDMIFWTGDNVPHDVWNTSIESCLEHNRVMAEMIRGRFPNVPVLPVLGNHEAHPINLYVPQSVARLVPTVNHSTQWLYETLANDYWSQWLSPTEKKTFLNGGFYSRMVAPKWKVIVLNTNHGYKGNFWFAYDPVDPDGQLKWLIDELRQAEQTGIFVTILAHIPPSDMYDGWRHNYIRIHDRFRHVITGGFMGHTHNDEIAVLFNEQDRPVGVQYISGSLTTFSYLNPAFKVFQMNATTGQPLDYDVHFFDLDKYNHNRTERLHPAWEFTARKSYRMNDLTPQSWMKLINYGEESLDLAYTYAEHYSRHSWEFYVHNRLNPESVTRMIKKIRTYSPFHKRHTTTVE